MMENVFKQYREMRGLTQAQLADRLKINQTTVSKWEHNIAYPHVSQLLVLQEVLRISNDALLHGLRDIEYSKGEGD